MALNLDKALGIHPQALLLRAHRAEALAANLSNADTPGYKARDIDFQAELQRALGGQDAAQLSTTHTRHLAQTEGGPGGTALMYRQPMQPAIDGNTVDADIEKTQFTENALQYQASLTFLNSKLRGLLSAIRGE